MSDWFGGAAGDDDLTGWFAGTETVAPPAPASGSRPTRAAAGRPPGGRRTPRRRRRGHPVLSVVLAALLAVIIVAGVLVHGALSDISPGGRAGRPVTVVIPSGSSTRTIASILARHGVIHGPGVFAAYVRLQGAGPLLAGTYVLPTNEPYSRVITTLESGVKPVLDTLVIPEGFTLREIAARVAALPGMHISAASFMALSSSGSVRSPYEPAGVNDLEGLLFPATYQVSRTETAAAIMTAMVQAFDERAQQIGLQQAAAALHQTPYQVVTVASIVQGEAKLDPQRPDVASVLDNRLRTGMTLGADSTLIYALRQQDPNLDLSKVNYEQPSPYNTRLHPGLPPTPIDNPGLPSLQAAAHPTSTNLLYFVEVKPDGELGFASTSSGFDQLISECRAANLC